MHPFREGNGRATRIFVDQLANGAGYELNWFKVSRDTFIKSVRAAMEHPQDVRELREVIRTCCQPLEESTPVRAVMMERVNEPSLLLKDLLLRVDGMPSVMNSLNLDAASLHRPVVRYKLQQEGSTSFLHVQLKGDRRPHTLRMDHVRYLTPETKERWIEEAARQRQVTPPPLDNGLEC